MTKNGTLLASLALTAVGGLVWTACAPPPPPTLPPLPPVISTTTTTTTTIPAAGGGDPDEVAGLPGPSCYAGAAPQAHSAPLGASQAAAQAIDAVADATVRTPSGDVPLVVVERGEAGPEVSVVDVADTREATRVAVAAAADGDLLGVEADRPVSAMTDPRQAEQWALPAVEAPTAWATSTGAGVVVAVLDTGVQTSHPDLAGQLVTGRSFLGGAESDVVEDGHGHGTHVSGIIAAGLNGVGVVGVAHGAKVMPVKVLDDSGSGWLSDVALGLSWANSHGAKVANLSLGAGSSSLALESTIDWVTDHGTLVVAAAGNSGPCAAPSYPAAYYRVLAVGSTTSASTTSSFSTTGTYVDVAGPGSLILSTWPTSLEPSGYQFASGTSMATPNVAGVAALVSAAHPTWGVEQVREALKRTATDIMAPGRDQWSGYGLVDAAAAVAYTP